MPPEYDFVNRFKELAGTKFNLAIEFEGDKWVRDQNFGKLENDHEKLYKDANTSLERLRSLEYKAKINFIIHKWLDPVWDKLIYVLCRPLFGVLLSPTINNYVWIILNMNVWIPINENNSRCRITGEEIEYGRFISSNVNRDKEIESDSYIRSEYV
jgi:hypothetical protein